MSTLPTSSHGVYPHAGRRSYISTAAFNSYFFKYTTSRGGAPSFEVTGTLGAVTGASASNCPVGRILRENGKKLFPTANPGVSTYMVGVYDANSGLNGFIDPNDKVFATYNSDKPAYLADGTSPTDSTADKGAGIYTLGDITTTGNLNVNGGYLTSSATPVVLATGITSNTAVDFTASPSINYAVEFSGTCTISTTTFAPAGTILYLMCRCTNASTLTLGTGFNVNTTVAPTNGKTITLTLYSNGTSYSELARSGAVTSF